MNETGARVHEVRLLLVCIVECSGSGRDDMDGCLLPASDVGVMLLCMRCLSCDIAVVWTYVCCRALLLHDVG